MRHSIITLACLCLYFTTFSQIISQFDWNNNPVTQATIGPDASSVSPVAFSDINGNNESNGLNPGTPKQNINFTIPGSPTFDVDGIDFSIDYQREESSAYFFERGTALTIRMSGGNIFVTYQVEDGAGGKLTITSGDIYSIPSDDVYRTYNFKYDPDTGTGTFSVDGAIVWSNDGPDNRALAWNTADDVVIGRELDGTGTNKTCLDNMIVEKIPMSSASLPIELEAFNVRSISDNKAQIEWSTSSELNNDYFTIEKSADGLFWQTLDQVKGAGTTGAISNYQLIDHNPFPGTSYYRLKQTDFDGSFGYFEIKSVSFAFDFEISVFPNPIVRQFTVNHKEANNVKVQLYRSNGRFIKSVTTRFQDSTHMDVADLENGQYYLIVSDDFNTKTFPLIISK